MSAESKPEAAGWGRGVGSNDLLSSFKIFNIAESLIFNEREVVRTTEQCVYRLRAFVFEFRKMMPASKRLDSCLVSYLRVELRK